jgi:hypothetical protein
VQAHPVKTPASQGLARNQRLILGHRDASAPAGTRERVRRQERLDHSALGQVRACTVVLHQRLQGDARCQPQYYLVAAPKNTTRSTMPGMRFWPAVLLNPHPFRPDHRVCGTRRGRITVVPPAD